MSPQIIKRNGRKTEDDNSEAEAETKSSRSWLGKILSRVERYLPALENYGASFWVWAYIVILVVGSQLTLLWKPTVGVYINTLALALLIGLGLWYQKARSLAISASILPLANMISLSLPQTSAFAQAVVFYDAILILAMVYRFIYTIDQTQQSTRLSLKGYATSLPLMLVIGQLLGLISYGALRHFYPYVHTSLPLVAATAVVFAISEETYFRGLIQQRAGIIMHPLLAALLSVVLFTFASIGHVTILAPLVALLYGAVLCFTYYKKQNLILTTAINAMAKLAYIGLLATFTIK